GETFDLRVSATPVEPHPKGRTFALVSEARVEGELAWEDRSTMLRRGAATNAEGTRAEPESARGTTRTQAHWRLPGDLGFRYAAVSTDRTPLHLPQASARLFGFKRAIAHGMWTKAACLAQLERELPDAYTVVVTFRKPILLPGRVTFAADDDLRFEVRSA